MTSAAVRAVTNVGSAGARMGAWRVHAYGAAADELRLEAARRPALRAPDHLLVRVHHAALNPIDVAMIGGYGRQILNTLRALEAGVAGDGAAGGVEFPLMPGRELVGEVVAAGAAARARPGQRVWAVLPPHWPGALAQYAVVRDCWAGPAPASLGAAAGGALYAGLTATAALRVGGLPPGSGAARGRRVLVLGLGGVGLAALQLLAAEGAAPVVGCSAYLSERALRAGATLALDRHAPDYDDQLIAAGPYECIVDCAGLGGEAATARGWRGRFSRYVTVSSPLLRETDARGLWAGGAAAALALARQCVAAARATPSSPSPSSASYVASSCLPPHVRWAYFIPNERDIELIRRLAENGQWEVCVEREWEWWRADEAFAAAAAPERHARGKLLLDFTVPLPSHLEHILPTAVTARAAAATNYK